MHQKCKNGFSNGPSEINAEFTLAKLTPRKIVLLGPMGVGKTTIGKLLADELGWQYFDNDFEMSLSSGLSKSQLSKIPVQELHELESKYLVELCLRPAPFIGGAAASVVDYLSNIAILKSVTAIYLRIPLGQVIARAGSEGLLASGWAQSHASASAIVVPKQLVLAPLRMLSLAEIS